MKPLCILNVAYPLAEVGPDAVGGAEQVVWMLDACLHRHGHRSIVLAPEGSIVAGELIPAPRVPPPFTDHARNRAHDQYRRILSEILDSRSIDAVHLHGIDFCRYVPENVPVIATLHLPCSWYPADELAKLSASVLLISVSSSQRAAAPPELRVHKIIENGIPAPSKRPRLQTSLEPAPFPNRRFGLAMGRICPEKGFHVALDAASAAGWPLILAGRVYPYAEHEIYFREEIMPRLDAFRRYIGPVGLDRKQALLRAAGCLVVSSLVPETSSLVAMEALACGTPVAAFRTGALEEIVDHGRTGFLARNHAELAEAIRSAPALSPEDCREAARQRFSADRMGREYIDLYRHWTAACPIAKPVPLS